MSFFPSSSTISAVAALGALCVLAIPSPASIALDEAAVGFDTDVVGTTVPAALRFMQHLVLQAPGSPTGR